MCIFANEGGPKSKSSRKETPLKIQKYKEIHVSGKNLEKKFLATTPTLQGGEKSSNQVTDKGYGFRDGCWTNLCDPPTQLFLPLCWEAQKTVR